MTRGWELENNDDVSYFLGVEPQGHKCGGFTHTLQQFESQMENSQQFYPENYSEESEEHYGPPKKQQKYVAGPNNGAWNDQQHTKYIVYMEHHKQQMRSKEKRRTNKFYKAMSEYIGTRNALQCRSHHQKLEEKYLYPNKIIANFKQHHQLELYRTLKADLEDKAKGRPQGLVSGLKLQEETPQSHKPSEQEIGIQTCLFTNIGQDQADFSPVKVEQQTFIHPGFSSYREHSWFPYNIPNYTPYYILPPYHLY